LGSQIDIGEFSDEEQVIIDRIMVADTWQEVVSIAKELYAITAREYEKQMENEAIEFSADSEEEQSGDSDSDSTPSDNKGEVVSAPTKEESKPSEENKNNAESGDGITIIQGTGDITVNVVQPTTTPSNGKEGGPMNQPPVTQVAMENNLKQFVNSSPEKKGYNKPVVMSEPDLKYVIVPQSKILASLTLFREDAIGDSTHVRDMYLNAYGKVKDAVIEFQKSAKSSVDLLCKQFEMKKAADLHKRTSQRTTGVLNMDRLHAYKVTDNLFLQRNVTKNGKNHGLLMFVDWSGSMGPTMGDTLRQMMVLMMFCRRCEIPYDIYAFSSSNPYYYGNTGMTDMRWANTDEFMDEVWHLQQRDHFININRSMFSLFHLFSSTNDKNSEMEMLVQCFGYVAGYERDSNQVLKTNFANFIPSWFQLNSTPLNETLLSAPQIFKMFVEKHKRDINHIVLLTDGEASGWVIPNGPYLLDPKTRGRYDTTYDQTSKGLYLHQRETQALVNWVRDRTGANIVCIELTNQAGFAHNVFWSNDDNGNKDLNLNKEAQSQWNKESYCEASQTNHAYDSFFIVKAKNAVMVDDFEDIDTTNMTPSKIKNQFIKYQKKKYMSRYMINRFVEMIAA
jgi:hypothetical protein